MQARFTSPPNWHNGGLAAKEPEDRRSLVRFAQRHREQAAELPRKVAADPGMNFSLPVEEARRLAQREDAFMPDVGVDADTEAAIAIESDEIIGLHVVAGQGQWDHEGHAVQGIEHLSTIRMVVHMPDHDPRTIR